MNKTNLISIIITFFISGIVSAADYIGSAFIINSEKMYSAKQEINSYFTQPGRDLSVVKDYIIVYLNERITTEGDVNLFKQRIDEAMRERSQIVEIIIPQMRLNVTDDNSKAFKLFLELSQKSLNQLDDAIKSNDEFVRALEGKSRILSDRIELLVLFLLGNKVGSKIYEAENIDGICAKKIEHIDDSNRRVFLELLIKSGLISGLDIGSFDYMKFLKTKSFKAKKRLVMGSHRDPSYKWEEGDLVVDLDPIEFAFGVDLVLDVKRLGELIDNGIIEEKQFEAIIDGSNMPLWDIVGDELISRLLSPHGRLFTTVGGVNQLIEYSPIS